MSRRNRHRNHRNHAAPQEAPAPPEQLFGRDVETVDLPPAPALVVGPPIGVIPLQVVVPAQAPDEAIHVRFTESELAYRHTLANGIGTWLVPRPDGLCSRLVTYDSIIWRCACGGSGPVGRSKDGIPFVDADILAHQAGETR